MTGNSQVRAILSRSGLRSRRLFNILLAFAALTLFNRGFAKEVLPNLKPSAPEAAPTPDATPSSTPEAAPTPYPTAPPFWVAKPVTYKKLKDDRAILVSSKSENVPEGKHLKIVSGGMVHAPLTFTHKIDTDFGNYSKFVPYLEESSYDQATRNFFVHGVVLGYHMRMTLHITDVATDWGHQIQWTTISGNFEGMKGTISESRTDEAHTEVTLQADYYGVALNVPTFILNWGLEFAAHRASGAMRSHIEDEWQKNK